VQITGAEAPRIPANSIVASLLFCKRFLGGQGLILFFAGPTYRTKNVRPRASPDRIAVKCFVTMARLLEAPSCSKHRPRFATSGHRLRRPQPGQSVWVRGDRLSTMLRPLFRIEVFANCQPVRVLGIQAHWWGDCELCLSGFCQLSESENGTQRQQQRNLARCDLEILGFMVPPWRPLQSVVFAGVESTLDGSHQAASFPFNCGSSANVCTGHASASLQGLYTRF
jgi:hypothetical protein